MRPSPRWPTHLAALLHCDGTVHVAIPGLRSSRSERDVFSNTVALEPLWPWRTVPLLLITKLSFSALASSGQSSCRLMSNHRDGQPSGLHPIDHQLVQGGQPVFHLCNSGPAALSDVF
ncbi:predicted protein [Plenodomus lingam JN3]|uniref:Predicted protein n=1 Tax=Leptosphaeria maculans (strain JN3 / isolate v23.1.3 / race Av1-4-5-6-7-8) TaxID=985895 RepID=E4ZMK8_LEPMJ|nr:predicted protein [Plenodomus lingam JN3]CBX92877.1 predicted protein [Plenodomus lingam JN3]